MEAETRQARGKVTKLRNDRQAQAAAQELVKQLALVALV